MGDYHTCANSRPQLGLGMASVYSCPHVSYKDGKLKSVEQCLNCRSYSDVRTSVDISCDTFRAKIYMNRLSDLTVRKAKTSLTQVNNQVNTDLITKINTLPKAHDILDKAKKNAAQIIRSTTTGHITITQNKQGADTLYISEGMDYTKSKRLWIWNMGGLAYSKDGGETVEVAMTMDGSITANFITVGTMAADRIRTGLLQSENDNFSLNLNDGTITMKKGSIDIGGQFTVTDEGVLTANEATIIGTIKASAGNIGGLTIDPDGKLYSNSGNWYVGVNGSNTNDDREYAFWTGNPKPENSPFWVKKNGELYASKGTFSGRLEAATGNFVGVVQASDFLDRNGNSIPTQKNIPTYDGTDKTPEWNNFDTENCTVQVTPVANAGEHSAIFTLLRGMWSDGSTTNKTIAWTVKRAPIAAVPTQTNVSTYDGNPKTPSWDANYSSDKMTVSVEAKVNAGTSYSASFTPDANHCWADGSTTAKTATWSINRATIATVPSQSVALTYTGNEQAVTLGDYNSAQLTLGGTIKGTNAGEYSANVTPTANYQWSDGSTAAKTIKWTIGKAAGSLSLSATSVTLNPSNLTKEITVTRAGDGAITASSSNTGVATVTVSGTIITIAHVNQTSGSATITVKVAAGTNHTAPTDKTIAVTASFREYLYGYDLTVADSNPATRVSYPSDVENSSFAKAVMNFGSSFNYGGWPSTPGQKFMPRPCMLKFDGTVS